MTTTSAPHAPPFCPNPKCAFHSKRTGWEFANDGCFYRKAAPQCVRRYRCRSCGRRFSEQTFRTTYWLKRPKLLARVMRGLLSCSCLRQIARAEDASPQTILLHANRLGRYCQLFHERHRPHSALAEPIALDGFQSFEYSQFHPTWFHVVGGMKSFFFYGFTESELRRSGSMTKSQKRERERIERACGKPDPRSIEKESAEVLGIVCPKPQSIELHTDDHQDYPRALKQLPHLKVEHHTISSRAARTPSNPLFTINLLDLLIRHSGANHKRETIAFAKRRQMAAGRLWVMLVWRNYLKWVSEQKHKDTPAMRLGIFKRKLRVRDVLKKRLFASHIPLPERWAKYYRGEIPTRLIPRGRRHRLRYAY
jgi:transposase-like protein